jgi:hypothetical protein
MRYYVWDIRVPPTWLEWVEEDIASTNWLLREVARFLVTFIVIAGLFNRLRIDWRVVAVLLLGVTGIVAGKEFLRKVAYAYQRYGWDWATAPKAGIGRMAMFAFGTLFSIVFALLLSVALFFLS